MTSNVALIGLARDLKKREDSGKPIRIGLVGCGEMGTDLLTGVAHMDGIEVAAVSTRTPERVLDAAKIAYDETGHAKEVSNASEMTAAIEEGKIAATDDLDMLLKNELVDVIVDATGYPEAGAEIGYKTLQNNKHVVMMNVEADVTIGPYLKHEAEKRGLIYTLGAGDEPSSCMELIEFVSALGHNVVAAGKGKNNPLDFDAIPDHYEEEAQKRNMNVRMLVEFIDGSKTMVEMTAIANATGLVPDCPGMHGPKADIDRLNKVLIPEKDGGVLSKAGVVDYSIGRGVSPGVFVVAEMRHPRVWERMEDLKIGEGPYFTFHRPYHLTAMEVPLTCARVMLYGKADMVPLDRPVAEVCAVAKKDLKPGDKLDFIGLYTYRAWNMTVEDARKHEAIPCGLLEGATVTAPIKKNELITAKNVAINEDQWIARLRKKQDKLIYG
ncbi:MULTISPECIES: NAD(P)H-dependent oxidoreductase [Bartonella]|uniref:NAD(P)H-dependent oxidoreductase n=1 Tax=Bartonella TaxID=773 RepID=UPI0018DE9756|nr:MULTISPECIES: NAD(P)H-dependent oxidoreductase [Bartonella]MBH9995817.1 homoserine dehydrogenase [Bartonella sp. P0291]MBH9997978.1 homoserine dehydrogenase [Bartonella sp. M0192]MBI0000156.1 homoserine dehydrogenase [Bartonella sp. M0191]MBI0009230.1 homoserine dehydrogenase [Bartonella sp. M0193]MBI0011447.1 homoserine dehydrogenase [Bartonella sp. M0176]